jgi:putative ABC transport system permease protein
MEQRVAESTAFPRFQALLLTILAGIALALAALGIYGILAEDIAERRREIGLRSALGARRSSILLMFVRHGLLLTAVGSVLGVAGIFAVRKAVAGMLFGTESADPVAILGVVGILTSVAGITCLIGADNPVRVDPIEALRCE